MTTDERLQELVKRGWRPTLATHLIAKNSPWVDELGAVTRHGSGYIAWVIHMRPGTDNLRRGMVSRITRMRGTIREALDLAEQHADNEAERTVG